jgi:hypothetical protein
MSKNTRKNVKKQAYKDIALSEQKYMLTPVTRQTGQVLVAFGMLFKHVSPFNETIDENMGETLISIGRKLLSD